MTRRQATAANVALTGSFRRPARTASDPGQEVLAQMHVDGTLRVSAAEAPRFDETEPVTYHVVDMLTGDEFNTDDRDEAVRAFRRFYLTARGTLRSYSLSYQAPDHAATMSFEDVLAVYLNTLELVSPQNDYTTTKGRKFLRVVQTPTGTDHRSVYDFVERETGRVMSPHGWSGPSKTTKGSLFGEVVNLPTC